MEDKLTLELLKEVKANGRKWFIIAIISIVILFASNMAWLYYWNLPSEEVTQDNEGGYNNYVGNDGSIDNGKTDNNQKK